MKQRINWIDSARGMAFLMVIYSHLEFSEPYVMRYLRPIFLTTFFFVSGYLFKREISFSKMIEQRIRTLLLPFFIYGIVNIIAAHIFTLHSTEHVSFMEDFKDFLFQIRGRNDGLWFIACLFISSIFFHQISKYLHNAIILTGTMMFLFLLNKLISLPPLPWHLQLVGYSIFYMSLGVLYKENEVRLKWFNNTFAIFSITLIYVMLVTIYWRLTNQTINFMATKYVVDGWIITVLGIIICVSIAKKIGDLRILQFVGANSLLYFALHGKGYAIVQVLMGKIIKMAGLGHGPVLDLFLGFLTVCITVFVVAVPVILINKYASFTLGKGFELRNIFPRKDVNLQSVVEK